jgi:hypothetical protein
MYRLQQHGDDGWSVIGEDNSTFFTGSLQQCEQWLDREENRLRRPFAQRMLDGLRSLFSCCLPEEHVQNEQRVQNEPRSATKLEESRHTPLS